MALIQRAAAFCRPEDYLVNISRFAPAYGSSQKARSKSLRARGFLDEKVRDVGMMFRLRSGVGNLRDQLEPYGANQLSIFFRHPASPTLFIRQMLFHPGSTPLQEFCFRLNCSSRAGAERIPQTG